MDFLNDQVNHLQKEDASPKTEDIDLEEDAENKKEVINNCEAVDEKNSSIRLFLSLKIQKHVSAEIFNHSMLK